MALLKNFDEKMPLRDICKRVWYNGFDYISRHRDMFLFAEQFGNSPYTELVNHDELDKHFAPLVTILNKGIEQKIIKKCLIRDAYYFYILPYDDSFKREAVQNHKNE